MLSNDAIEQVQIHPAIHMQEEAALSAPFPAPRHEQRFTPERGKKPGLEGRVYTDLKNELMVVSGEEWRELGINMYILKHLK